MLCENAGIQYRATWGLAALGFPNGAESGEGTGTGALWSLDLFL